MSDLISREDAMTALSGACSNWEDDAKVADIINGLPSATPSGDLISRADAIEAVAKEDCCGWIECKADKIYCSLNALPSAETAQEWIPCSERLPDVDVEVLATTDWSDVQIVWLIKGGAWETDEYILDHDEITAWMPLPKPYKGGDE